MSYQIRNAACRVAAAERAHVIQAPMTDRTIDPRSQSPEGATGSGHLPSEFASPMTVGWSHTANFNDHNNIIDHRATLAMCAESCASLLRGGVASRANEATIAGGAQGVACQDSCAYEVNRLASTIGTALDRLGPSNVRDWEPKVRQHREPPRHPVLDPLAIELPPTYIGNSGGGIFDGERHVLLALFSKIYTHGTIRPTVIPHMGLASPLDAVYDWLEDGDIAQVVPDEDGLAVHLELSGR